MSEFRSISIGDIAANSRGAIKIGPFGSQLKKEDMVRDGIKVYGQENIIDEDFSLGDRRISPAKFAGLSSCELHPGDVVMTMMGTIGRCSVFPGGAEPGIMDSHLLRIQPDKSVITSEYLAAALSSRLIIGPQISQLAHGSIMSGLSSRIVRCFRVPVPTIAVQRMTTEILETADDATRSTERLIAKQMLLTTHLAANLFTGVKRFDGEVNTVASQAIGEWTYGRLPGIAGIPDGWRLVRLAEYARLESGHTPSRDVPGYWSGSIPWLSLHDTSKLDRHIIHSTKHSVTTEGINNSSARLLPEGTVAFSRTATVGKCVILGRIMATSQDFACYVCGPQVVNRYLMHLFRHMQSVWRSLAGGSTHQTVYMPVFEKLQILLPPIGEQVRIADALDAADLALDSLRSVQAKQRAVKQGLMDDLLTGRVGVGS